MKTVEFRNHLCKIIDTRVEELKESLACGLAKDHGAYLSVVGQVQALRQVKTYMMSEALKKTLGPDAKEDDTDV
jgi:hypothetical protein